MKRGSKEHTPERENCILDILTAEEQEPEWLIPNIFTQGSLTCIVGESGAGKSYVLYTMALAIAAGVPALTGLVAAQEPKRVVYFDDENGQQDRDKYLRRSFLGLKAQNHKEPNLKNLHKNFWPIAFALGTDEWAETAREIVGDIKPHLIVIDTATPSFNIQDENSNSEAAKAIKQMRALMKMNDPVASSWIIKHAKTRTEAGQVRTVRGAKVWKDMSDGMLFQVKAGGRPRKDGLSLTRLVPDKVRAYGLQQPIYITPRYTDAGRTGLILDGSFSSSREHKKAEAKDEDDD